MDRKAEILDLREEDDTAYKAGEYIRASRASAIVLQKTESQSGRRSAQYAQALSDHALNLNGLGRPGETEPLFRRALSLFSRACGENHLKTLDTLRHLADTLRKLGRAREAEPLLRRAVALTSRTVGNQHPSTLSSLNSLALTLKDLGRSKEAEPLYRRVLRLQTKAHGEKHPDTLAFLSNLAVTLNSLGRPKEAEPLYRRILKLRTGILGGRHPSTLMTLDSLASTLKRLGHTARAEPLHRRALALRTEVLGEKHPNTLTSLNNLALSLHDLGRASEAEPLYRRAMALRTEVLGEKHPSTLKSVHNLASNLNALGRVAEAELLSRRVLAVRTEVLGERHPDTVTSLANNAFYLNRLGRSAEAEPLYRRALALRNEVLGAKHPSTLRSLDNLAGALRLLGRASEAEPLQRRALALWTLGDAHPSRLRFADKLAYTLLLQPKRAMLALLPARTAVQGWNLRRKKLGSSPSEEGQLERDVEGQQKYHERFADAAWAHVKSHPEQMPILRYEAFTALQDAMMGPTSQAIVLMAARHAAERVGPGLGSLAREREALSDQWRANEAALTAALAESGTEISSMRRPLQKQQARVEAQMSRIDALLSKDAPQYFALIRPDPLTFAAARELLAADEAALIVVPTEFGTHVMAVTRQGLSWSRSQLTVSEVNEAVDKLRRDLDPTDTTLGTTEGGAIGDGYESFDRGTAHRLYRELIAPVSHALAGKRHVFVAAGGALASLPFGVLVTQAPLGDDADPATLRGTRWFADSHALIQLPSLQSLQFLRSFSARRQSTPGASIGFAGYGDPLLGGLSIERGRGRGRGVEAASVFAQSRTRNGGGIADIGELNKLSRLPGTATELENIRRALGAPEATVHLREAATEAAVRAADLSSHQIIAFATHGLLAGELKGAAEPGLVFTPPNTASEADDGLLTASEITTLKLNTDWVILSACNTAAGNGTGAPGLSGLARAFFYAGAKTLLASHWPVRDDVAAEITVDAITRQQKDPRLSRAEALQAAAIAIRNSAQDHTRAHPSAWAPFSLVGEGSR